MLSVDYNMFFSFKCLVYKYPLVTQLVLIGSTSVILAYQYQILEGHIPGLMKPVNFYDSIWVTLVIITTVGFGDIYAVTNLGRLVMITTSLVGIFLVSLIIMSLQKEVQLNNYEYKAFDLVARLNSKEENNKLSANYASYGIKYLIAKKKYLKKYSSLHTRKAKIYSNTDISKSKIMNTIENDSLYNLSANLVKKEEEELKNLLFQRMKYKHLLKKQLNVFYKNFQPYNIGDTIRKRLKDLNERFEDIKYHGDVNAMKIDKITRLIKMMEDMSFVNNIIYKEGNVVINNEVIYNDKELSSIDNKTEVYLKKQDNKINGTV